MIDIKLLRENPKYYKKATTDKGYSSDVVDLVLILDKKFRELTKEGDDLRSQKKKFGPSEEDRKNSKKIGEKINEIFEKKLIVEKELKDKLSLIPNPAFIGVPIGRKEEDSVVLRGWGVKKNFDFNPKNHLELGEDLKIINFIDGSKVTGAQSYYLDNEGALLEFALIQLALQILSKKGFTPTITPDLARSKFYLGTGYMPKGDEAQIYTLENEDLGLIATSEVTLAGRHSDEIIDEKDLPIKYAGVSHCFRREAGAYGKYSKGLYRVHQFTKIEMFVYSKPEDSEKIHEELLEIEEEIWQKLNIPYRVLEICTGDLGAIAARKFDLEAWMPGRGDYGEITSTSNCTDYQSRNLNIRIKSKDKGIRYAHLLNGTAIAISRALIAILENYQNKDGTVNIPEVLVPMMGGIEIINKKN
jgi:seryl-tRNA synthetase